MLMASEAFLIACLASGVALDADSFACWLAHPTVAAQDSKTTVNSFGESSFFIAETPVRWLLQGFIDVMLL
jgi:hypothetical protein